jgi:DNA polymerase
MTSTEDLVSVETALEDIRRAALGCVACKLHEGRTQVVFGIGNPRSPMVLVGQSPGEQEDRTGEPFVGRAGQLLNECLGECGIRRDNVWISNVVKCRPYTVAAGQRARDRDPEEDEISACQPWVEAELALIRPRVIICIGGPSAGVMLGRKVYITKERGQWFQNHRFRPAWVMPVLHPAYILRQHGPAYDQLRQQLIDDLEQARQTTARLLKEPLRPESEPPAPTSQPSLFGDLGG